MRSPRPVGTRKYRLNETAPRLSAQAAIPVTSARLPRVTLVWTMKSRRWAASRSTAARVSESAPDPWRKRSW